MNDFRRAVLFLLDNLVLLFIRRGTMAYAIAKMLRGVRTVAIINLRISPRVSAREGRAS